MAEVLWICVIICEDTESPLANKGRFSWFFFLNNWFIIGTWAFLHDWVNEGNTDVPPPSATHKWNLSSSPIFHPCTHHLVQTLGVRWDWGNDTATEKTLAQWQGSLSFFLPDSCEMYVSWKKEMIGSLWKIWHEWLRRY